MKRIEGKGENWFVFRCPGEGPAALEVRVQCYGFIEMS